MWRKAMSLVLGYEIEAKGENGEIDNVIEFSPY